MALITAHLDGYTATVPITVGDTVWRPLPDTLTAGQTYNYWTGGFYISGAAESNVTLNHGRDIRTGYTPNGDQISNGAHGVSITDCVIRHHIKDPATSNHVDGMHLYYGVADCRFERILIEDFTNYGMLLSDACTDITITDCWVGPSAAGNSSIGLVGGHGDDAWTRVTIDNCILRELGFGSQSGGTRSGIVVKNCRIGYVNRMAFSFPGITWSNVVVGSSPGTGPLPAGVTINPNVDLSKPAWAAGL